MLETSGKKQEQTGKNNYLNLIAMCLLKICKDSWYFFIFFCKSLYMNCIMNVNIFILLQMK